MLCAADSTPSDNSLSPLMDDTKVDDDIIITSPNKTRTTEDLFAMIHRCCKFFALVVNLFDFLSPVSMCCMYYIYVQYICLSYFSGDVQYVYNLLYLFMLYVLYIHASIHPLSVYFLI